MAGQSAYLTLNEACRIQEKIQASGSHAQTHGGSSKKSSKTSSGDIIHSKASHQE